MSRENHAKSLAGAAAEKAQQWQALTATANLGRSTQVKQSAIAHRYAHPYPPPTHRCRHAHTRAHTHTHTLLKRNLNCVEINESNEGCRLEIFFLIYRGVESICKLKEKPDREGETWNTAESGIVARPMKKRWLRMDPGLRGKHRLFLHYNKDLVTNATQHPHCMLPHQAQMEATSLGKVSSCLSPEKLLLQHMETITKVHDRPKCRDYVTDLRVPTGLDNYNYNHYT